MHKSLIAGVLVILLLIPVAANADKSYTFSQLYGKTITLHPGDRITVVNDDKGPHSITDSSQNHLFDSGQLYPEGSTNMGFPNVGTYNFVDSMNPANTGTIIVVPQNETLQNDTVNTPVNATNSTQETLTVSAPTPSIDSPAIVDSVSSELAKQNTDLQTKLDAANTEILMLKSQINNQQTDNTDVNYWKNEASIWKGIAIEELKIVNYLQSLQ